MLPIVYLAALSLSHLKLPYVRVPSSEQSVKMSTESEEEEEVADAELRW